MTSQPGEFTRRPLTKLDVVALGDAMVGFVPPGHLPFEQASTGALACTIVRDFAVVTRTEVEELLASGEQEIQR